jgi:hypothetical protein
VRRANFMVNSSAVRLAGDINAKVTDKASLDGLLAKIKAELTKLGPILDLEIVREPQGWTEGGVTVASRAIEHARVQGLELAVPFRPVLRLRRPLVRFGAEAAPGGPAFGSGAWPALGAGGQLGFGRLRAKSIILTAMTSSIHETICRLA